MEPILERFQKPILETMQESATKHAERSNGLLLARPVDLHTYPHQSLQERVIHGEPTYRIDIVDSIASVVRSGYPKLKKSLSYPQNETAVSLMDTTHASKQNTVAAYEHGEDVITFVVSSVALTTELRNRKAPFNSVLFASKMLSFLAISLDSLGEFKEFARDTLISIDVPIAEDNTIEVVDVLKKIYDRMYLTIPSTRSTEVLRGKHKLAIKTYNGYLLHHSAQAMKENRNDGKPDNIHVATSGTVNKTLDTKRYGVLRTMNAAPQLYTNNREITSDSEVEVIGYINPNITKTTEIALTFAMAAKLKGESPQFNIDPEPICLDIPEKTVQLGKKQAALLQEISEDKTIAYDCTGNAPVKG